MNKNKEIVLNCGSGSRYSVLQIVSAFQKFTKKKFKISYKKANPEETQTICSDNSLLKMLGENGVRYVNDNLTFTKIAKRLSILIEN